MIVKGSGTSTDEFKDKIFTVASESSDTYTIIDSKGKERELYKHNFDVVPSVLIKVHLVSGGFLKQYEDYSTLVLFTDIFMLEKISTPEYFRVLEHWLEWLNKDSDI